MTRERVLIIDDSIEIQDILRNLVLEPAGYRTLTANQGAEGLRLALEETPDLIILDEQLPEMTGLQVMRTLYQRGVNIPVIFSSAHGSENVAVQAFRLGARDYFIKPFDPAEMLAAVERLLQESRLRSERDQLIEQLEKANKRLQQQLQELNTLYSIAQSMTSQLDLDVVLTRVVEAAVFLTRAEEGLLLLKDPLSGNLMLRAAKNVDEKHAYALRIRVQDSLTSQVIESGEALLVVSGETKVATGFLVKSLIYSPLRAAGRGVIGILGVTNHQGNYTFTARDVRSLGVLADYAAIALENARLYEQAESERRQLTAVLWETEEGILVLDSQLNVRLCNPAASTALDLPVEVVDQPILNLVQMPALRDLLLNARKVGRTLHAEIGGGVNHTYNAQLTPVEGVGYVLMLQDITHHKELDRVKSEFVSTVSHDLRTPLTTIRGYVDLLEKVGPLNEQQGAFVQRVRASINHITNLISDLLDLGRIEAGYDLQMEPLHLEGIIDAMIDEFRPLAEQKNQELRWTKTLLPLIRGNPLRLRQVIENLLGNAIKYTQEDGWVSVEMFEDDGHVVVRVADNGIGIPLADQPHVFDRFYRVQGEKVQDIEGTGLGLAIVKSVIERHGGRIWVESHPGDGSIFTFVLQTME